MTHETAKLVFGENYVGADELMALPAPFSFQNISAPTIPFDDEVLKECAHTHVLVLTPQSDVTVNWLRNHMGTDPAKEPCMYSQDWYLKEDFAEKTFLDGGWHLIRKEVREDFRAASPDAIEAVLMKSESFPTAVTSAFTFFAWWLHTKGKKLWEHDFVWCSDRDHNGDRIYVGRYEDPEGLNKRGFNIHRHLAIRGAYSAAPEIRR